MGGQVDGEANDSQRPSQINQSINHIIGLHRNLEIPAARTTSPHQQKRSNAPEAHSVRPSIHGTQQPSSNTREVTSPLSNQPYYYYSSSQGGFDIVAFNMESRDDGRREEKEEAGYPHVFRDRAFSSLSSSPLLRLFLVDSSFASFPFFVLVFNSMVVFAIPRKEKQG